MLGPRYRLPLGLRASDIQAHTQTHTHTHAVSTRPCWGIQAHSILQPMSTPVRLLLVYAVLCRVVLCCDQQTDFKTVGFSPHHILDLPTWLAARHTMLSVLAGKTAPSELRRYPRLDSTAWWREKKPMQGSWGGHGCAAVDPYVYCVGGKWGPHCCGMMECMKQQHGATVPQCHSAICACCCPG